MAVQEGQRWQERALQAERGLETLQLETAERISSMQRELARVIGRGRTPPRPTEVGQPLT